MKTLSIILSILAIGTGSISQAQDGKAKNNKQEVKNHMYIDVHQLEPGKVSYDDVMAAHQKDLATQGKYGVNFVKFWVDEKEGLVYCLSSAPESEDVKKTHAEAHGLVPSHIYEVSEGEAAKMQKGKNLYLDIHYLGEGKVTAADVAAAHVKDLAKQEQYGVNFINYWVDEKEGVVMCLSQADDENAVVNTHKEAHGLIPAKVLVVKQGE